MNLLLACPVCFGDPSSPMTRSAMWGVLFLLGVVVCVLAGIASVAVVWSRRAKALDAAERAREQGISPEPGALAAS
jgi:hypothetical protein